jgi:hypothetical protein
VWCWRDPCLHQGIEEPLLLGSQDCGAGLPQRVWSRSTAKLTASCIALRLSSLAELTFAEKITAERVIVDGTIEGPIEGGEVILKSQARVVGDIYHQSLALESGAYFDGRSQRTRAANGWEPQNLPRKPIQENAQKEGQAAVG